MKYIKDTFAKVGDQIGVTTAAGYYEFVVTRVDRKKSTAEVGTLCDWYMGQVTAYFAKRDGHNVYLNANMMKRLKPRNLTAKKLVRSHA